MLTQLCLYSEHFGAAYQLLYVALRILGYLELLNRNGWITIRSIFGVLFLYVLSVILNGMFIQESENILYLQLIILWFCTLILSIIILIEGDLEKFGLSSS